MMLMQTQQHGHASPLLLLIGAINMRMMRPAMYLEKWMMPQQLRERRKRAKVVTESS